MGRTQEEAKQSTPSTGYKNNKPTRQLSSLQHQQDNANQRTSCLANQTTTCLANPSTPVYRRLHTHLSPNLFPIPTKPQSEGQWTRQF